MTSPTETTLQIEGMTCASCVARVERALAAVPGVASAQVNLATESAQVRLAGPVSGGDLVAAVEDAGYEVAPAVVELSVEGMSWEDCTVTGYLGGEVAASRRYVADPLPATLEVAPDATTLGGEARDEVRVMVRALDQAGNPLPFLADSVEIAVEGPARLMGPPRPPLLGGTTGFWLRASGERGTVRVRLWTDRFAPVTLDLQAE